MPHLVVCAREFAQRSDKEDWQATPFGWEWDAAMSDLLIGNAAPPPAQISDRLRFTDDTRLTPLEWGGFTGVLARVENPGLWEPSPYWDKPRRASVLTRVESPELWEPASDPVTGITLGLTGRAAFDDKMWREADALPYQGGKACKLLLRAWLRGKPEFLNILNGVCAVLVFDPGENVLHLITDRLGIFPVYRAESDANLRLCSHPDVLADWLAAEGQAPELDLDTIAECLATGSSVHPHTYHRNVKQLDPATHYTFTLREGRVHTRQEVYWDPRQLGHEEKLPVPEWIELIADALRLAARRRTAEILGKPGLLLSGGLDARAILFGASDPSQIVCATFCDRENAEARTAMQLAAAAGAPFHLMRRDPEHYAKGARANIRLSGGMWSIQNAHYHGLMGELRALGVGVMLTGDYADYLLKGLAFNKAPVTLFGKPLPFYTLGSFDPCFYQPHFPLSADWNARVAARLAERFPAALRSDYTRDQSLVGDLRTRPLSRNPDALGDHYLMRTLPWDPVMADNGIIDLYTRMPPALKLDFRVYSRAVARVVGKPGRHILNNNYGAPLEAGMVRVTAANVLRRLSRKWKIFGDPRIGRHSHTANPGSWPTFSYYVGKSPFIAELWSSPSPFIRELFTAMLGKDPWGISLQHWGEKDDDLFLRLLTVKLWLEQRQDSRT